MAQHLGFDIEYHYSSTKGGILIPVALAVGDTFVESEARVDTGAEHYLFERDVADALGLEVEGGRPMRMRTLTGSLLSFGHEVTLQTFDLSFFVTVYFAQDYGLARNLLGRQGWLQLVHIGLRDYEETLYLSAYEGTQ
jgi:hypothetical protein